MFGFWGFQSFEDTDKPGDIPYPCKEESAQWGHAVVAVGYDDNRIITNLSCKTETKGALLIRNSWGKSWGEDGYGWLPYEYVLNGLALDFWSLLDMRWIDTGQFWSLGEPGLTLKHLVLRICHQAFQKVRQRPADPGNEHRLQGQPGKDSSRVKHIR